MKRIFLLFFFNCASYILHCALAQAPLVKMWDYRYGGTDWDVFTCFQQTKDGGYILGGSSTSGVSGDKSQPQWGGEDFWVVKLDSMGIKQWDKDFGGTSTEEMSCIIQTTDGGYILGGYSASLIGGDKSQDSWGGRDFWIVKIDSLGNKIWDKDFGGFQDEWIFTLQQTTDGGYILGGYSQSGIGGDKTEVCWDTSTIYEYSGDFWVVKIDSLGNKQWDKTFGGIGAEKLFSLLQTNDGGYMLGGFSWSSISGNKTTPSWDPWVYANLRGDYWIVKIDSSGTKQWEKYFGGTSYDLFSSIRQTNDGGYLLGGESASQISGDKTQNSWSLNLDYWILKIDSLGNKEWDKDYGGLQVEDLFWLDHTTDDGFLLSGDSFSPTAGGDKSENNLGTEQPWLVKTDSSGNKLWEKTILTYGIDDQAKAIQSGDGCYVIASNNDAGPGGDKSQPGWGLDDFWIVKFCELPVSNVTALNTNLCPGTCTSFLNLSTSANQFQWSFPGALPDTSTAVNPANICYQNSGSFDVQLISSNSSGSDTLLLSNYITVYPSPAPQAIAQSGDTLFANAGSASYQWYFNGNIINGATDYFYVAPSSGDYNVVATDVHGCEVEAAVFNVIASVQSSKNNFPGIEPNPFSSFITLHFPTTQNTTAHLKIFNSIGETVFEKEIKFDDQTLNLAALPKGIYLVSVMSKGSVYNQEIVK